MHVLALLVNEIMDWLLFFAACGVTLSSVHNNIPRNFLNVAHVWEVWVGKVQQKLDVNVCMPALQKSSVVLNGT